MESTESTYQKLRRLARERSDIMAEETKTEEKTEETPEETPEASEEEEESGSETSSD